MSRIAPGVRLRDDSRRMEDVGNRAEPEAVRAGFAAVNAVLGSLGRVCMALDANFRVRHVSQQLDTLLGQGAAQALLGQPVENLFGAELFGPGGSLREALAAGEKREGWRASLRVEPAGSRLVSVTVAPLRHDPNGVCDLEATYVVVMRPADETDGTAAQAPTSFGGLIARSASMTRIFRQVENLQASDVTVLLTGESGTGKEVLARAIHTHSNRRNGPFVAVNCAALPGELLEAELFGHVRGAFTGAVRDRAGRFELAADGTLFLDEVGDLPLHLQVKLLRVLQERTFERVGESRPRTSSARIIAATNKDLRRAVETGTFREDLYYRLRVFPIELPPLRERREDIEPLASFLLGRVGGRHGRALRFSPDALRAILDYPWPGNVRELENALEYAVTVAKGHTLVPEDLPPEVLLAHGATPRNGVAEPAPTGPGSPPPPPPRAESPSASEEPRIRSALEQHHWNRAEAAAALGMSRTTLWRKMRELGLR
ncbi:MAG: response regulator receiver protein [Anaeromyxobacteraceae bacterium]|jgi:transcriptional regulator with GAF, ATPase, and Fis domain|nr:response regulator receiver protein [Anaeromyxobacteraceae bacterium]